MSHTQGRLRLGAKYKADIYPDIGKPVLFARVMQQDGKEETNARRLVACWNACEGMPTDLLEQIPGVVGATLPYHQLVAQRNELLEALKELHERLIKCSADPISAAEAYDSFYQDIVLSAINKAEEKA